MDSKPMSLPRTSLLVSWLWGLRISTLSLSPCPIPVRFPVMIIQKGAAKLRFIDPFLKHHGFQSTMSHIYMVICNLVSTKILRYTTLWMRRLCLPEIM